MSADGSNLKAEWARGRMFDREVAAMFMDRVKVRLIALRQRHMYMRTDRNIDAFRQNQHALRSKIWFVITRNLDLREEAQPKSSKLLRRDPRRSVQKL